ncbi:MAG: IS1182 family transposase [Gammaproteobacteria bacterium]
MTTKTFRPYDPDQMLLMPPALSDWVPEGHLARGVGDLVDTLDLSAIEDTYAEERGYPPYHPRMMVKLLVYGYCTGTYSSRRIAERLVDSVAFRFLAAGNQPDFRTISDFRKRHGEALERLFDQVLEVCQKAGLVKLGKVAVDGTKIKANASKHKAMSYGRMKQKESDLRKQVREMLKRAEQIDKEEDRLYGPDKSGDELPAEFARAETRLKKIREAKAALEAEARAQAIEKGKDPDDATPPDKAQRNFTDSDSKIQKTKDGYIQGYNAQVAVDDTFQVIVSQHVTPTAPDVNELMPAIDSIKKKLRRKPKAVLADAGYWSEKNVEDLNKNRIEAYIATERQKHGEKPPPIRGRPPAGLSMRQKMARKLRTVAGRKVYSRRKTIVEPVFGQIKQARSFRQFLRRGLENVRHEWALVCTAHNILKLFTAIAAA